VIKMPVQLPHLAQAYFHQDYDLEYSDPDAAVISFGKDEGKAAINELISEIDVLLASEWSESDLANVWINELGAAYDPRVDGQDFRGWFARVRYLLSF
jgi:cobalamin biosynthesis Mg chelatase CobN